MLARCSPLVFLALSACVIQTLPPAEAPDLTTLERSFDEPWIVIERDLGGHALIEFASRAGSLEGGEPLVAAMVAEAIAERVGAIATVLPGLTLIRKDSTPSTIASDVESLLEALRRPLGEDEIAAAFERIVSLRRAQEIAHSRAAILAAFEALGVPEAIPLGSERDPLPSSRALEAFRKTLAEPAHSKWIFVGEFGDRTRRRLARLLDDPKGDESRGNGGEAPRNADSDGGAARTSSLPLRQLELPRKDQSKKVAGPASWALVAALPKLEQARSIEGLIRDRAPFRGASLGLAPSSAGAFLVISGEGRLGADELRFMKSELIRLSRPLLPRAPTSYRDAGEAIAGVALEFASDARSGDIVLALGIAEPRASDDDLLAAFADDPEFISFPHDDFTGYGTSIALRLKRALADEPRSEAGRTELLLEALRRKCLARGLEVEVLRNDGDAIARLYLNGAPQLGEVDRFIQCFLRDIPSNGSLEAARAALLRRLAADPYQDLLERLSIALAPSSASLFFGVESKTVRDRGRTRALHEALEALRLKERVDAAVAGERAGAVAEQLGYALAALPKGERERSLSPAPIGELRSIAPIEGVPVMGFGVRLEIDRGDDLSAYLRALTQRLESSGVRLIRAERSSRGEAGFIALIVSLGGDDPVALRQRVEAALPDERAIEEARVALEYEDLLRGSGPSARAIALLNHRSNEAGTRSAPRLVGIVATLGAPPLAP